MACAFWSPRQVPVLSWPTEFLLPFESSPTPSLGGAGPELEMNGVERGLDLPVHGPPRSEEGMSSQAHCRTHVTLCSGRTCLRETSWGCPGAAHVRGDLGGTRAVLQLGSVATDVRSARHRPGRISSAEGGPCRGLTRMSRPQVPRGEEGGYQAQHPSNGPRR